MLKHISVVFASAALLVVADGSGPILALTSGTTVSLLRIAATTGHWCGWRGCGYGYYGPRPYPYTFYRPSPYYGYQWGYHRCCW
jgi:hypothetical protein